MASTTNHGAALHQVTFPTSKALEKHVMGVRLFFNAPDIEVGKWCTSIRYIALCSTAFGWCGYVELTNNSTRISALQKLFRESSWRHSTMPRGQARATILAAATGGATAADVGVWLKEGNNQMGLPRGCRTGKLGDDHANGIMAALERLRANKRDAVSIGNATDAVATQPRDGSSSGIVVTGNHNVVSMTNITVQPVVVINLGNEVYMDQLQTVSKERVMSALENPLGLMVGAMPEVSWFNHDKPHQHTLSSTGGVIVFRTPGAPTPQQVIVRQQSIGTPDGAGSCNAFPGMYKITVSPNKL
jgi:hypothetical protein